MKNQKSWRMEFVESQGICYITVTSVPPKQPCTDCDSQSPGCLVHSFVAHMKYSTVSTLSPVLSPDGMKIDDLMILNMGHSIGVISLGLLHKNNAEGLPLSSIKHATFEDRPTEDLSSKIIEFSQPSDNCDMTDESHSVQFSESFNLECGSSQELFSSQNTSEPESVPSQCF
uniref:DDB1- and CUL4-associated factor 15 WD40 repeat-containing domain-containing protein n=1 Tax=Ciona savignyi TaxID=51511 RepID=H2Z7M2_CIOSA